jgi:NAD(P)-dependent dehydrogenase (short-subunit alcohol dehydrogenase family)
MRALEGRTVLVTGATQGIGLATARALARMGAEVLVTARDRARGDEALRLVRAESGGPGALLLADLSSRAGVRALAGEVLARAPRLHVLVNNAGAIHMQRAEGGDGIELTLAVNHLAPFLLTHLLLDRIRESAPARIVTVASAAHTAVPGVDFGDLEGRREYAGWKAYGQSKLANILFTRELARRLEGTGVTANCLHPGVVRTGFGHNTRGWLRWGVKLAGPLFLSPERGAETSVYLASSPEVEAVSGQYFARKRPVRTSAAGRDAEAARRLWALSEKLAGLA